MNTEICSYKLSVEIWMVLFQVEHFAKHRSHVFSIVQMIVCKYMREDVSQWLQIQVPFPCSCRVENVQMIIYHFDET